MRSTSVQILFAVVLPLTSLSLSTARPLENGKLVVRNTEAPTSSVPGTTHNAAAPTSVILSASTVTNFLEETSTTEMDFSPSATISDSGSVSFGNHDSKDCTNSQDFPGGGFGGFPTGFPGGGSCTDEVVHHSDGCADASGSPCDCSQPGATPMVSDTSVPTSQAGTTSMAAAPTSDSVPTSDIGVPTPSSDKPIPISSAGGCVDSNGAPCDCSQSGATPTLSADTGVPTVPTGETSNAAAPTTDTASATAPTSSQSQCADQSGTTCDCSQPDATPIESSSIPSGTTSMAAIPTSDVLIPTGGCADASGTPCDCSQPGATRTSSGGVLEAMPTVSDSEEDCSESKAYSSSIGSFTSSGPTPSQSSSEGNTPDNSGDCDQ
ncbi:hypothetical protein V865_007610 [Kwoniella europaea PYCC6329]|uniref:Uncharacterized protein n=1 Tax=Kwoniella europaea PYCC6329 TaxID=1423913 RepID=A0AAX4KSP4_9TREE